MNLHDAVVQSCDVFLSTAVALGIERMQGFLRLRLGAKTGVDLKANRAVFVVAGLEGRGLPWYGGETVITGIGQARLSRVTARRPWPRSPTAVAGNRARLWPYRPQIRDVHLIEPQMPNRWRSGPAHLEATSVIHRRRARRGRHGAASA